MLNRPITRITAATILAACILSLLMMVATYRAVNRETQSEVQYAIQGQADLAASYAAYVDLTLERMEMLARATRRQINDAPPGAPIELDRGPLAELAMTGDASRDLLLQIATTDKSGRVTASSLGLVQHNTSVADRPHFRHFADHRADVAADQIFIGAPLIGRVSNRASIQLSLPLRDAAGGFDGMVVISMSPRYFGKFFDNVRMPSGGIALFAGQDGLVRFRTSEAGGQEGLKLQTRTSEMARLAAGEKRFTVIKADPFDGVTRIYAFNALAYPNLYVLTSISFNSTLARLADTHRQYWISCAIGVLFSMACAISIIVFEIRREHVMRELAIAQAVAEEADRSKTRMLAMVSHELRTPLNGIAGFSQVIRDTAESSEISQYGGYLVDATAHLNTLVNQMLELAKAQAGRMEFSLKPTEWAPLIEGLAALQGSAARAKGLDFSVDIDAGLPPRLTTDETRLRQILTNLLNNAIKFTPSGRVSMRVRRDAQDLLCEVTDTGIGIPADKQPEMFRYFGRVRSGASREQEGAGIGLALSRDYAELLGGSLSLVSAEGRGTTFTLRLPLAQDATDALA